MQQQMQIAGIPNQNGSVTVVCSECGPIGEVTKTLLVLRILAHYHHHQTRAD